MSFFNNEPTIKFISFAGGPEMSEITRIKLAREVKPEWLKKQKGSEHKFSSCPGMDDWLKAGYIIPAWTDIHIKANSAGLIVKFTHSGDYPPANPMADQFVKGIIDTDDDVKFCAYKLPTPWAVFAKAGYSAHVLPALFHSPFLRDLFLYPGTVDYDSYSTINVMFSPIRECDIKIPAGTPLLQVIPFKREDISAEYKTGSDNERLKHKFQFPTRVVSAYRKFFHKKKNYSLKRG